MNVELQGPEGRRFKSCPGDSARWRSLAARPVMFHNPLSPRLKIEAWRMQARLQDRAAGYAGRSGVQVTPRNRKGACSSGSVLPILVANRIGRMNAGLQWSMRFKSAGSDAAVSLANTCRPVRMTDAVGITGRRSLDERWPKGVKVPILPSHLAKWRKNVSQNLAVARIECVK